MASVASLPFIHQKDAVPVRLLYLNTNLSPELWLHIQATWCYCTPGCARLQCLGALLLLPLAYGYTSESSQDIDIIAESKKVFLLDNRTITKPKRGYTPCKPENVHNATRRLVWEINSVETADPTWIIRISLTVISKNRTPNLMTIPDGLVPSLDFFL